MTRHILTVALLVLAAIPGRAEPLRLVVTPASTTLIGPRAAAQFLAAAPDPAGRSRDLTRLVTWRSSDPRVIAVGADGFAAATGDGSAEVTATLDGISAAVRVTVRGSREASPVSFRDEVIPVLNRAGCNMGACHGTPNGKGGFKLSLRGYDVPFDYRALTREANSRRLDHADPDASLLLLKGTGRTAHGGGPRFGIDWPEYQLLRRWVADGSPDDPKDIPPLARLEIRPASTVVPFEKVAAEQQVRVVAHFADGSSKDVTRLCCFSVSDESLADVSTTGLVKPMRRGEVAVLARYLDSIAAVRLTFLDDRPEFAWPGGVESRNYIDEHVQARLRLMQIPPSGVCSDGEFLRRAYLDACGILPTPDETRAFLADPDPAKRDKAIDALLKRPEFDDFWALKWSDVLRLNEKFMGGPGVRDFHKWVRDWVAADKPLDEFARQVLAAKGTSRDNPPVSFYRTMNTPEEAAESVAQLFLGARMGCARCHNHPFEKWTQDEYYGFTAFFGTLAYPDPKDKQRDKPFAVRLDPSKRTVHPRTNGVMRPRLLGAETPDIPPGTDPRDPLAAWLTAERNPFFARVLANRIWFHLNGRGLVEPVDDFRDSNPPANEPLLNALADDLVKNGWRLRPLVRNVLRSRTYQTSATPNPLNKDDGLYSSRAGVRLLTAEQMLDGVCAVTGVAEKFGGSTPMRAAQIPGLKEDSMFLTSFNRPARNLVCECEREKDANLSQALQLISSKTVQDKLASDNGRIARLLADGKSDDAIAEELYLAALCRLPSERERTALKAAMPAEGGPAARREFFEDLAWSLLNSKEFQYRH